MDPEASFWTIVDTDRPSSSDSIYRAVHITMDIQVPDDGRVPKQNHLYAVRATVLKIRESQRLCSSVSAYRMGRDRH